MLKAVLVNTNLASGICIMHSQFFPTLNSIPKVVTTFCKKNPDCPFARYQKSDSVSKRIKLKKRLKRADSPGPSAASLTELLWEQHLRFPISSCGKNSAKLFWSTLNATRCWMQKCLRSFSYHHYQFCHWLVGCMGFYEPQDSFPNRKPPPHRDQLLDPISTIGSA